MWIVRKQPQKSTFMGGSRRILTEFYTMVVKVFAELKMRWKDVGVE